MLSKLIFRKAASFAVRHVNARALLDLIALKDGDPIAFDFLFDVFLFCVGDGVSIITYDSSIWSILGAFFNGMAASSGSNDATAPNNTCLFIQNYNWNIDFLAIAFVVYLITSIRSAICFSKINHKTKNLDLFYLL